MAASGARGNLDNKTAFREALAYTNELLLKIYNGGLNIYTALINIYIKQPPTYQENQVEPVPSGIIAMQKLPGNVIAPLIGNSGGATFVEDPYALAELQTLNSLIPSVYDYISLGYTGDNLTGVVFKNGGAGGTVVSTLTLSYTGSNLTAVTKS